MQLSTFLFCVCLLILFISVILLIMELTMGVRFVRIRRVIIRTIRIRRTRTTNCQGLKVVSISSMTPSTATPSLDNHIPNISNIIVWVALPWYIILQFYMIIRAPVFAIVPCQRNIRLGEKDRSESKEKKRCLDVKRNIKRPETRHTPLRQGLRALWGGSRDPP